MMMNSGQCTPFMRRKGYITLKKWDVTAYRRNFYVFILIFHFPAAKVRGKEMKKNDFRKNVIISNHKIVLRNIKIFFADY